MKSSYFNPCVCVQLESLRFTGRLVNTQIEMCNLMHLHTLRFHYACSHLDDIELSRFPATLTDLMIGYFVETMIPLVRDLSGLRQFALCHTIISKDGFNALFAAGQLANSLKTVKLDITWKPINIINVPDEIDTTKLDVSHLHNVELLESTLSPIVLDLVPVLHTMGKLNNVAFHMTDKMDITADLTTPTVESLKYLMETKKELHVECFVDG